ncbi:hypothetical protein PIROE2DRAFT_15875 [Piromyces sp. E2]|nr:hypothetical protein PIROE2DRAFT_15875 [Piromyces sp. E2]|eukprot:OUM58771.1 hypothetical protein PIROE2DRAFT_15875 [Piromyces sp. E2]
MKDLPTFMKITLIKDINAIVFLIENFDYISNISCSCCYRFHLKFPKNVISKYSKKIFKPNVLYFNYKDHKEIESYANNILSDEGLINIKCIGFTYYANLNHHYHNFGMDKPKSLRIENFNKYKECTTTIDRSNENLNFNNKSLFNCKNSNNIENEEIIDLNNYIIEKSVYESDREESYYLDDDYEEENDSEKKLTKV